MNLNGVERNLECQEEAISSNKIGKYGKGKILILVAIVSCVIVFSGLVCVYAGHFAAKVYVNINEVDVEADRMDCSNHLNTPAPATLDNNEESNACSGPQWVWTPPPDSDIHNSRIIFVSNGKMYTDHIINSVPPGECEYYKIEPYRNFGTFTNQNFAGPLAMSADKIVFKSKNPNRMIVQPTNAKSIKDIKMILIPDLDVQTSELAIRPDGKEIAFKAFNETAIQIVDLSTFTFKQLQISNAYNYREMVYSPDSKYIYIQSDVKISTFDAQTGAFVRDYSHPTYKITAFTVSPDGKRFIIISEVETTRYLFSVGIQDGSSEHLILQTEEWISSPGVSPDGKWVIFRIWMESYNHTLGKVYISPKTKYEFEYIKDEQGNKINCLKATWISI